MLPDQDLQCYLQEKLTNRPAYKCAVLDLKWNNVDYLLTLEVLIFQELMGVCIEICQVVCLRPTALN